MTWGRCNNGGTGTKLRSPAASTKTSGLAAPKSGSSDRAQLRDGALSSELRDPLHLSPLSVKGRCALSGASLSGAEDRGTLEPAAGSAHLSQRTVGGELSDSFHVGQQLGALILTHGRSMALVGGRVLKTLGANVRQVMHVENDKGGAPARDEDGNGEANAQHSPPQQQGKERGQRERYGCSHYHSEEEARPVSVSVIPVSRLTPSRDFAHLAKREQERRGVDEEERGADQPEPRER